MTSQLRYLLTYEQMVGGLLKALPEEEAVSHAVGGDYERVGVLEHAVLRNNGLRPDSAVVDVGCGSGRLASQLRRYPGLRYLGTDVVPALLDYARRKAGRPDFRFERAEGLWLPVADGEADFVVFFSVFTHLLHEESYVYLMEAHRALRPGGRAIFSFLEFSVPEAWTVFDANIAWVRNRTMAGHLNVFMHRQDLRLWAERLGFRETGRNARLGLDLTAIEAPEPVLPDGIEIVTWAERPDAARGMYEVASEALPDIPGDEESEIGTFEEWLFRDMQGVSDRPEMTFVALAGDKVVGYAKLVPSLSREGIAIHDLTGVLRDWRGRGIAAALKATQIAWAKRAGYAKLETSNEVRNEPIRRLNEQHGYVVEPGEIQLTGPLGAT